MKPDPVALEAEATGFPPEGTIFPVRQFDLRVAPGPHPFYERHKAEIAEHWRKEIDANPALFDGQLVFLRSLSLQDGIISAEGHLVPYSMHLWWRKLEKRSGGFHAFAWATPVSADGGVIAIRMGPQTANPGLVYCAAGSLEAIDIAGDRVDIEGNMLRELKEETGLDGTLASAEPLSYGLVLNRTLLVFRIYRFPESADTLLAAIGRHMAVDHEQEIDAALAIRTADPDAHRYNDFMKRLLRFVFPEAAD